ncbi:MAG TPA: winged helix-turn-helix domain-containing protein [Candidatus Acidoferrum sp.]|nr:winged helix-turn-helix domain-containing protein [Candidatus Acidoferrum sp.]
MTPNVIPAFETGMDERSNFAPLSGQRFIRFGPFQLDQHRQELSKNGSRLKLQGKVYQVLVTLAERPGEVVTREELRQRLWPADTHVNYDANVNTTVNKLRQVLGDSTDKPAYIETIPRKGYSMVARLEFSEVPCAPTQQDLPAEIRSGDAMLPAPPAQHEQTQARSGFWMPIGVAGLVLAGMLLGAGLTIATLWLSHFAQTQLWP